MTEKRGEKRRQLGCSLQVYDGISSRMVGHVADLTPKGIMLVCREPVGVQAGYRLRIKFPDPIDGRAELNVRAFCRWCREDVHPDIFVAGFQFQELSEKEARFVSCLIDDFGFQGWGDNA